MDIAAHRTLPALGIGRGGFLRGPGGFVAGVFDVIDGSEFAAIRTADRAWRGGFFAFVNITANRTTPLRHNAP
jgi:hypothetical protein